MLASLAIHAQTPRLISGTVWEVGSRKPLSGVHVYAAGHPLGGLTDQFGSYKLMVPIADSLTIVFSHVGYETARQTIFTGSQQTVNSYLTPGKLLAEVTVKKSVTLPNVGDEAQLSRILIPVAQLDKIPALFGEKDVLKVIQLMPGVQKGSEGNTGVYVRGGGPDQNLITVDEAVVYNPSHLLGFFSVFNGDVLKSVELAKGGFPARFGGRLSSVIEMEMQEGDRNQLHGTGSFGLIASRFTLEGPLQKEKSSFLVSARQCYLGLLTQLVSPGPESGFPTRSGFSDYNAKLSFDLGPRDHLSISGYRGADQFKTGRVYQDRTLEAGLGWGNATGTLHWRHRFSRQVSLHTALLFSHYRMEVSSDEATTVAGTDGITFRLRYRSSIRDFSLKQDIDVYAGTKHQFRFGFQVTPHQFRPSAAVSVLSESNPSVASEKTIDVVESGVYAEDFWQPTQRWRINAGLRMSHYLHQEGQYVRPEPRLSVAYKFPAAWALKAAYARMNQYVHMVSNTGVGLPTDLWVPTTDRVKPQQSEQLALGVSKEFSRGLALSVEGYHKTMLNNISYREGASFLLTDYSTTGEKVRWEDNVTAGKGWSYGAEVLVQKKTGRLTGWMGYTLSWTQWQFAELNGGRKFFPRYDRRHDLSVVSIYEIGRRITLSGTWVYGTGQALTIPLARYVASGNNPDHSNPGASPFTDPRNVKGYGEKNGFRAEPYHRMDISVQFHSKKKTWESIWELSIYNAYNRRNPFYYSLEGKVEIDNKPSKSVLYRYSLFPVVPTVSYTVKF